MTPNDFRPGFPGSLVPIPNGYAFVPDPLPPSVDVPLAVQTNLAAAGQALGMLYGYSSAIQNDFLIQRPLMTREAVKSARIEGTYVMVADVPRHEAGEKPPSRNANLDNLEVTRYLEAVRLGVDEIRQGHSISAFLARSLHKRLLEGTRGQEKRPGEYRSGQVAIGAEGDSPATARFVPPPPLYVGSLMDNLFAFVTAPSPWPPLVATALAHYQFEAVHPFEDGNGRLGRLLIPLTLMAHGVLDRPLLYLSDFFDAHRDRYFHHLHAVSCDNDWLGWINFFLEAVSNTAQDAVTRIQRITTLHATYRARVIANSRSQAPLAAVDLVMDKVIVTAAEVEQYARCSNPTARNALETLEQLGIVENARMNYPARWIATELIDQAYER